MAENILKNGGSVIGLSTTSAIDRGNYIAGTTVVAAAVWKTRVRPRCALVGARSAARRALRPVHRGTLAVSGIRAALRS